MIIDHLNRYVSDVDKFILFYEDALDYKLIDSGIKLNGKKYAILKGDKHELFVSEREDFKVEEEQNFRHIGYLVENLDELLDTLKIKGYVNKEENYH